MKVCLFNIIALMFFSCNTHLYKHRFQPEDYFSDSLLPLAQAIYNDDARTVREYMTKKGIDVNTVDEKQGYTLLLYAISTESKSVIKTLLEMGANPNLVSATKVYENSGEYYIYNRYPLSDATYKGDLFFAKILLKYGADPNLGNPLHVAIINTPDRSEYKMFDLLLEHGSNINAVNNAHKTPVFLSAFINRTDYVNYFIDKGANIHIPDNRNETAAWLIQEIIDACISEKELLEDIQGTIKRFEERGVKFPVEKPNVPQPQEEAKP
jgi:ankyrin repeat protein